MADDVVVVTEAETASSAMESTWYPETHLFDLPPEIIGTVLKLPCISIRDVSRFARTCQKINALVTEDSNDVWRAKHRRRWPDAQRALLETATEVNWLAECKRAFHLAQLWTNLMDQVWPKVHTVSEVCYSYFAPFRAIMEEDKTTYYYLRHFLLNVITEGNVCINMTQKYLARKVLQFISQEYLTENLKKFKAQPAEEQLLEIGAAYIAQWSEPMSDISTEWLGGRFDQLADAVMQHMAETDREHPIFTIPLEDRRKWGKESLKKDRWTAPHCMQILHAMDRVLIEQLGFHGSMANYHDREAYLINEVLERRMGMPLTLNIIVESVARRLGVRCEPFYRGNFVLLWRSDMDPDAGHVYLDAYHSGGLIRLESYMAISTGGCPYRNYHSPQGPTTCMEVMEKLTAGLEISGRMSMRNKGLATNFRSALELMFIINPKNLNYILQLARLYMLHNISVSELIESVVLTMEELPSDSDARKHAENILQMLKVYCPETKPKEVVQFRSNAPNVRFAVGMSMFHKQYNYLCVIVTWDDKCCATDHWKHEMGVQFLKYKDNQPFYHVLVPDGTTRYAAQENLQPLSANHSANVFNSHPEVGRFFQSYQNGYYTPHNLKAEDYPDDLAVCRQFYESGL